MQLRRQGDTLSFWRTRAGLEVKHSVRIDKRDLAGLTAFGVDDPHAQRWLLSLAPEPLLIDGIRCEPLEPCLRQLRP